MLLYITKHKKQCKFLFHLELQLYIKAALHCSLNLVLCVLLWRTEQKKLTGEDFHIKKLQQQKA